MVYIGIVGVYLHYFYNLSIIDGKKITLIETILLCINRCGGEAYMKKQYENAEMEILEFEVCDVITMSLGDNTEEDWGDFM